MPTYLPLPIRTCISPCIAPRVLIDSPSKSRMLTSHIWSPSSRRRLGFATKASGGPEILLDQYQDSQVVGRPTAFVIKARWVPWLMNVSSVVAVARVHCSQREGSKKLASRTQRIGEVPTFIARTGEFKGVSILSMWVASYTEKIEWRVHEGKFSRAKMVEVAVSFQMPGPLNTKGR